jgi:hypothetical protein
MELSGQELLIAHELAAVPSLITLFITSFLIWLIVGLTSTNNHKKFITMFIITFLLSGLILLALIFIPGLTQWIRMIFN